MPPLDLLRRVFGFPAFRGLQEPAIAHVLAGGDALILMPTGGGKSLCYQVPALCRPGTAIIVSPLIALMDDQVAALRQLGISAAALHSELDPAESRDIARSLAEGGLDLLYVSPERLLAGGMLDRLSRLKLALIAIDEAHCVSQWGHEFRPEYRALAGLGARFPGVPRLALTATADARTRDDILAALAMDQARVFTASFHRPNLFLAAQPKAVELTQLDQLLARHRGGCGIVYCGSRAKTERVAAALVARGHPAVAFHAGLDPDHKRAAAGRFRSGEPLVVVATIAFGMGVDRPDVRFVAHLDMPDSPEAWYQQIGRAGRDGDPAETLLLHGAQDIAQARHWLAQSTAPEAQQRVMRTKLEQMIGLSETVSCRTRTLLSCFGEELPDPCGHCDNCRNPPQTFDGTTEARKLLSAVYRTGQIFGAIHLTAVLRGEATEAVIRHGHDRLPTFGVGADQPAAFWRGLTRQMIARGVLDVDTAGHGGLFLNNEAARPILRGEATVLIRQDAPAPLRARRERARDRPRAPTPYPVSPPASYAAEPDAPAPSARPRPQSAPPPEPENLFKALRAWRADQARAQSVPPYVIFHDTVLREIAAVRPSDLDTLAAVKGVGASKLARYGPTLLALIATAP